MRLGIHFGPVFISSGGGRHRRASRRDRRLAWQLGAGAFAILLGASRPWFALPIGVAAAMAVTWWWLKRQDTKPPTPAESAPVAGGGSAGREQGVRR